MAQYQQVYEQQQFGLAPPMLNYGAPQPQMGYPAYAEEGYQVQAGIAHTPGVLPNEQYVDAQGNPMPQGYYEEYVPEGYQLPSGVFQPMYDAPGQYDTLANSMVLPYGSAMNGPFQFYAESPTPCQPMDGKPNSPKTRTAGVKNKKKKLGACYCM